MCHNESLGTNTVGFLCGMDHKRDNSQNIVVTSRQHRDLWVFWIIILILVLVVLSWQLIPWAIGFKEKRVPMNVSSWDISRAANHCDEVATVHGWEGSSYDAQTVVFKKGEKWLVLHLAVHGGIVRAATREEAYDGPNREAWAIRYLEEA